MKFQSHRETLLSKTQGHSLMVGFRARKVTKEGQPQLHSCAIPYAVVDLCPISQFSLWSRNELG